ncbi:hypothetical protein VCHA53O466_40085 [Vibrio chagasii]|nr:hypothetical protein VCHA53O466_40085 [Vibrio chagasii]
MKLKLSINSNKHKEKQSPLPLKEYVSTKEFKNRDYRFDVAIKQDDKYSLKDCASVGGLWYRMPIYIGDLIHVLSDTSKYLPFELEKLLGQSQEQASKIVNSYLETLVKTNSITEARKILNDSLPIKNPLLTLLRYFNANKLKFFTSDVSMLFTELDFKKPKTLALVKRSLAITAPMARENAQKQFSIDTGDLKISGDKVLYICKKCLVIENIPNEIFAKTPILKCKCGQNKVPCRHMFGYKTTQGVIVSIKRSEVKLRTQRGIVTKTADELIGSELSLLENSNRLDEITNMTSLMLWHHKGFSGRCSCVECCS